jgi:hypothetical protein
VAWYKLNGDLTDSSGVTGSATNQGGTLAFAQDTNLASNLPYAWYAVGSAVSGTNYALTPALNRDVPLSFAFWFKTTAIGTYSIMGYGDRSGASGSINFDWETNQLKIYTSLSVQWNTQPVATGLAINTWYFAVYTLSNTSPVSAIIYIDGTQRATAAGTTGQTLRAFKDFTIGGAFDGGRGFAGQIADVRIYNKALTQDEITVLYTNMPDSLCASCPAGTYSGVSGASNASACVACPAGTYSGVTGASSVSACVSCPTGTFSASGSSNISACIHRSSVTLTVTNSGPALTNFQLKFTLTAFGTLSRNFNTLRVYVAGQQAPVPHWIENATAVTTAEVWVKIPSLVNGMILTVTDDNPNSSNPDDVFELFDTFDGTALNSSKWVIGAGQYTRNGKTAISNRIQTNCNAGIAGAAVANQGLIQTINSFADFYIEFGFYVYGQTGCCSCPLASFKLKGGCYTSVESYHMRFDTGNYAYGLITNGNYNDLAPGKTGRTLTPISSYGNNDNSDTEAVLDGNRFLPAVFYEV